MIWTTLIGKGRDPYKKSQQGGFAGGYKRAWLEDGEIDVVNDILARAKSIREREQDAQLSRAVADLAERSCDTPGSVSQAELNALPRPHDADYVDRNPLPTDPRPCVMNAYLYLGRGGVSAGSLESMTTPPAAPIDLVSPPPPPPVPQVEPPAPLASALPLFKKFATAACLSPEKAWMDPGYL